MPRAKALADAVAITVSKVSMMPFSPARPHDFRDNAFDHLRLIAALMVLLSHQGLAAGLRDWPLGPLGSLGVEIFFAISGYLNAKSLFASRSAPLFIASRALRIYPGLIFCLVFTILLGAAVTTVPLNEYFGESAVQYFVENVAIFTNNAQFLPGVFEQNPARGMNASIWTLGVECRYYLFAAAAFFVLRFNPRFVAALILCGLIAIATVGVDGRVEQNSSRLGLIFCAGVLIASVEILSGKRISMLLSAIGILIFAAVGQRYNATMLLIALVSIAFGNLRVTTFKIPIDISYGVYLLAFPIQQAVVFFGFSLWTGLLVTLIATFSVALVSAVIFERPALRLSAALKRKFANAPPEYPRTAEPLQRSS